MKLATLGWVMVLAAGCGSPEGATVRPLDMTTSTFPFDGGVPHGPPPSFGPTVTSPVPPVPLSGGTLRVLDDGKTAVATDPDRDNVYIADLTGPTLLSTVALNAGDEPGRVVEDAAGHVHVLARRGGAVVAIDPATGTILDRRAVCPAPPLFRARAGPH